MRKKIAFIIIIFNAFYTYCQSSDIPHDYTDSSRAKLITNNYLATELLKSKFKVLESYKNILGSPYIENRFGIRNIPLIKVFDSNMIFIGSVFGFYNAYTDEMEVSTIYDGSNYYLLNKKPNSLYIKFHNKTYKAYEYNYKLSYFVILSDNDKNECTLLKKEKVIFLKADKQGTSLVPDEQASFVRTRDLYYVKLGTVIYKLPRNKKKFYTLFGKKSQLIEKYLKKKKLKLNSEQDLISIMDYYNSLYVYY